MTKQTTQTSTKKDIKPHSMLLVKQEVWLHQGYISKSDTEVLNEQEEQAKVIVTIHYSDWRKIVNHKLQAYILNLAELRGAYAVYSFIDKIRHSPPNLRSGSHLQLLKSV